MPMVNLLPFDGVVNYLPGFLSQEQSEDFFEKLLSLIQWRQDEVVIYGKHIKTRREMAWYAIGDLPYKYSNISRTALPFTEELFVLKKLVEAASHETYNACLLNLYHNGEEGMGWHSDDERSIVSNSCIASVSLGPDRKFSFRHKKSRQIVDAVLQNGSLLLMKGITQNCWQHALPKMKKMKQPRINLTFRKMEEP